MDGVGSRVKQHQPFAVRAAVWRYAVSRATSAPGDEQGTGLFDC